MADRDLDDRTLGPYILRELIGKTRGLECSSILQVCKPDAEAYGTPIR